MRTEDRPDMTVEYEMLAPTPRPAGAATGPADTGAHRAVGRSPVSAGPPDLPPLLCWAFYAFIFSLPVETIGIGIPVSGTRFLGYFFFLLALFHPGVAFGHIPTALGWFGLYLLAYATLGM